MRNVKLTIEYEGTNYAGWQIQTNHPSVQGAVASAVRRLKAEPPGMELKINGASRTDAGVHAAGQVANFFTPSAIPPHALLHGLNAMLPFDIVVKAVEDVPPEFDSRRHSTGKVYIYRILNRQYPSALLRNFSWYIYKPLDTALMKEAAKYFIGEKDFASFCAAESDANHTKREVTSFEVYDKGGGIIEFEVRGRAFLRHMVRIMAGTLAAVGKGKIKPGEIKRIIEAKDRRAALMTAPAQGLTLVKVEY